MDFPALGVGVGIGEIQSTLAIGSIVFVVNGLVLGGAFDEETVGAPLGESGRNVLQLLLALVGQDIGRATSLTVGRAAGEVRGAQQDDLGGAFPMVACVAVRGCRACEERDREEQATQDGNSKGPGQPGRCGFLNHHSRKQWKSTP